jgi:ABC-type multidrug transport system fused ATPase/permease subunit
VSPAARALWPYVRRQWKALAGAGGATGVLTAADLAKPWPLAIVVDELLGRTAPFALEGGDWRLLAGVAALVLAIALAEAGATYLSNLWLQTAGERISHELRVRVYDHLQAQSLAFHQRSQKGDLLTRVTGDVNAMGDLFAQSLGAIAQAALLLQIVQAESTGAIQAWPLPFAQPSDPVGGVRLKNSFAPVTEPLQVGGATGGAPAGSIAETIGTPRSPSA